MHSTVATHDSIFLFGGYDEGHRLQATVFEGRPSCHYKMDACPRMLYPVFSPACCVYSDRIYLFGGYLFNCKPLLVLQTYSLTYQDWSEVKLETRSTGVSMENMACHYVCEVDDNLYVVMGYSLSSESREISNCTHDVPVKRIDFVARFCPRMCLFVDVGY